MNRPSVRLVLDLEVFDEARFEPVLEECRRADISFESLETLGDTPDHRARLYRLNKQCSADIPGRGAFYSFEDYLAARFERAGYNPGGVVVALHRGAWVGLAVTSDWRARGFCFNEMTGVLRAYRRQGVATAMKLLGIRFARGCGVGRIYTIQHLENVHAIEMNRRLGFVDTDWDGST